MLCRSIYYKSLSCIFRLLLKWQESLLKSTAKDLGLIVSAHFQWLLPLSTDYIQTLGLLRRVFSASVATQAKLTLHLLCAPSCSTALSSGVHFTCRYKMSGTCSKEGNNLLFIMKGSDLDYRQRLKTLHLLPLMMEFALSSL